MHVVRHCKKCDKFHESGTKVYKSHRKNLSKVRNIYRKTARGGHSNTI